MAVQIRKPNEMDRPQDVAALYYRVWQTAYRDILPQTFLDALSVSSWHPEKRWNTTLLAVDESGKVRGVCTFGPNRQRTQTDTSEIYSLYVDNDYRHGGIGRQLLQATLEHLPKDRDCYVVVLNDNSRARHFYECMGFTDNLGASTSETKYGSIREVTLVRKSTRRETKNIQIPN